MFLNSSDFNSLVLQPLMGTCHTISPDFQLHGYVSFHLLETPLKWQKEIKRKGKWPRKKKGGKETMNKIFQHCLENKKGILHPECFQKAYW